MIKAVFFDIDGTLVSFKTHKVAESTVRCLEELKKKGVKVFIATGRQFRSINNLGDLEFDGYITLNGGYCLAGKEQLIYKRSIPDEDINALREYLETDKSFPCAFVVEEGTSFMNYKDERVDELFRMLNFPEPPMRPIEELEGKTVLQLIAFFSPGHESEIMAKLPHCEATRWNPLFSDVVPAGSSKAVGIDKVIEHYGIELSETMAFGDGGNDIAMLRHVGVGVAMGNAEEDVKQAADYTTTSVDEDGIYHALKHFNVI